MPVMRRSSPHILIIAIGVALYLSVMLLLPPPLNGQLFCFGGLVLAVAVLVLLARTR